MNYNDTNITCSYIQNLLATNYTPTVRILKDFSEADVGEIFIYKNGVYKKETPDNIVFKNQYHTGLQLYGITKNCITTSTAYSSDLHEALGDYLRLLRDQEGVDLLPLYNCFSNRYEGDFSLPIVFGTEGSDSDISQRSSIKTQAPNTSTRLAAIPVKFEMGYHIYCKQPTSAIIQLALYDKKDLITYNPYNTTDRTYFANGYADFLAKSLITAPLNNTNPVDIVVPLLEYADTKYRSMQRCLYLFIEVPAEYAEDLVVQEFLPEINLNPDGGNPTGIVSHNTLLQNDGKPAKPFSNKLLGYLLNFFISPTMPIPQSINQLQRNLTTITETANTSEKKNSFDYTKCSPGVFDTYTQAFIYNRYREDDISDYIGYVDRDVDYKIQQDLGKVLNKK